MANLFGGADFYVYLRGRRSVRRVVADSSSHGFALAALGRLTATAGVTADVPQDDFPQDDVPGIGIAAIVGHPGVAAGPLGGLTATATGTRTTTATAAAAALGGLTGVAIATVSGPLPLLLPRRANLTYELLVVARIPLEAGAPTFLVVDPIQWNTLEWSSELSAPQTLNVTCSISSLTEPILQRLRVPSTLATELWLLREGRTVFAGPLTGGRREGETLTLHAEGLLGYLNRMVMYADHVFAQADQATMVKTFVDSWQALSWGNFGIDTSAVGTTGVLRDGTYLKTELHRVLQRVQELGKRENGFDVDIDPITRQLHVYYPSRGTDRSEGEDAVVFDARNITNASTMFSLGPDDFGTVVLATGTANDNTVGTLYTARYHSERAAQYGMSAVTSTWDTVKNQATLNEHADAFLVARDKALFVPGPNIRATPDADRSTYDVGDTVHCDVDDQLGVTGAFRLKSIKVSVSKTGQELITPTFV